jgi:hypothetical protein
LRRTKQRSQGHGDRQFQSACLQEGEQVDRNDGANSRRQRKHGGDYGKDERFPCKYGGLRAGHIAFAV